MIHNITNDNYTLNRILELNFDSSFRIHIENGGLLNRFNNVENSVLRIEGKESSYILKISNNDKNILNYFYDVFSEIGFVSNNLKELLHFLSLLPGRKEFDFYELIGTNTNICYFPQIKSLYYDVNINKSYILMQDLGNLIFYNYLTPFNISNDFMKKAIQTMAEMHNYLSHNKIHERIANVCTVSVELLKRNSDYFKVIAVHHANKYNDILSDYFKKILLNLYDIMLYVFSIIDSNEKIFTHNDFSIRNTCINASDNILDFKIFDWDLCRIQNKEFDFVEYFIFLYYPVTKTEFEELIDLYIENSDIKKDKKVFINCIQANILWFVACKWCIYASLSGVDHDFIKRLSNNIEIYLNYFREMETYTV